MLPPWSRRQGTQAGCRSNLSATLKIFLSGLCPVQARRCLDAVLKELATAHVERLIIALTIRFPRDYATEAEEGQAWADAFWPLWLNLEGLVKVTLLHLPTREAVKGEDGGWQEGKVKELGVADLELWQLKALTERCKANSVTVPAINHYNIQSCCSVPDDLQVPSSPSPGHLDEL